MKAESRHVGCVNCGYAVEILVYSTELFFDFGGWIIWKDKRVFYLCAGDNPKTLKDIEKAAEHFPESEWKAELSMPLRGAWYKRNEKGIWRLESENQGFA